MRAAIFPAAFSIVAALLLTASCASLSEEQCRAGDWAAIGRSDGLSGRSEGYVTTHAQACSELGIAPDFAAWNAGRLEGIGGYCTPARAYSAGQRGQRLSPVCQGYDLRALSEANFAGLRYREIGRDIDQVRGEIRASEQRIDDLRDGDTTRGERSEIRRLRADIDRWRRQLYRLGDEQRRYALWY